MAISFSMQSPASYFHKHVAISAHINVTIYLLPYLVVLSILPCNWTHTYVISQGTPIPWWIPHNMKPNVTPFKYMFMRITYVHAMSSKIKDRKTSCIHAKHSFICKKRSPNIAKWVFTKFLSFIFFLTTMESLYVLSYHPTVIHINKSTITLSC